MLLTMRVSVGFVPRHRNTTPLFDVWMARGGTHPMDSVKEMERVEQSESVPLSRLVHGFQPTGANKFVHWFLFLSLVLGRWEGRISGGPSMRWNKIGGGVWSVSPVVFSVGNLCGIVHSGITTILSVSTISTFSLAAFICAGTPPIIPWGSYPVVGKGHLENYKFCNYCKIPKSPRAHHCRSCGMCILDMDHHCPFIGNCVGSANHRHFILFLISAIISTIYVAVMCSYAMVRTWPPIPLRSFRVKGGIDSLWAWSASKEIDNAVISFAIRHSPRELLLVYLFMVSVAVNVGLSMLLWQQLYYIYEGKTYLGHLSAHGADETGEKDCKNLLSFFGCPFPLSKYLSGFGNSRKKHKK